MRRRQEERVPLYALAKQNVARAKTAAMVRLVKSSEVECCVYIEGGRRWK